METYVDLALEDITASVILDILNNARTLLLGLLKDMAKIHMYVLGKLITSMDVTIPQFRILILLETLSEPGLDTNILAKGMTEILKHLIRSGEMYSGQ